MRAIYDPLLQKWCNWWSCCLHAEYAPCGARHFTHTHTGKASALEKATAASLTPAKLQPVVQSP